MTWSIYKDTSRDMDMWEPCYTAWFVDYTVDSKYFPNKIRFLHDGDVDVYFGNDCVKCNVVNGQWAPDTEEKILAMAEKTYWGEFIEGFAKNKDTGRIEVLIGS